MVLTTQFECRISAKPKKRMLMSMKRLLQVICFPLLLCMAVPSFAQDRVVTGKVTDSKDGTPVVGASVQPKGSSTGTSTGSDGSFRLSVPSGINTIVVSSVEFETMEVDITGKSAVDVSLKSTAGGLSEVVVIGYGTARKSDLTGAVASVKPKDFNQGIQIAPDQLIQGKVAGVQVINNSGQPGGATTFKIRGNTSLRIGNQPLFVIDGVIVDGTNARPGVNASGVGATPDANPLNFINPNDIASIDVLKDASATAIYGSRGANGVVIVTTKKGQSGLPRLELNSSVGISKIMKKIDIMDASMYKQELAEYGLTAGDYGANTDAYDAILQEAFTTNTSVAVSGGNENARYRLSGSHLDQEGILKGTGLKKLTANFNSSMKLLNNRRLGLDFNLVTSQTKEKIGAISTDAGFTGNVISTALQFNPTRALRKPDGSINNYFDGSTVNPLELVEGYNDRATTTTILGSISPSYKITDDLEYKLTYGFNYGTGIRRTSLRNWVNLENVGISTSHPNGRGWANVANNELLTQQVTQTLSYNKRLSSDLNMNALLGYEYYRKEFKGTNLTGRDFGAYQLDYTDYLQFGSNDTKRFSSFRNPLQEIRSYFARFGFDYRGKYLLTATFRADGSSKFGSNNRYGYFPSFAAAWNINKEDFFHSTVINMLKLRAGWGITGNQEFPSGASLAKYNFNENNGGLSENQLPNKDLQWQQDIQANIGLDFALWNNRVTGTVDYFNRTTKKLLFPSISPQPSPGTTIWINLDGQIENKGFEVTLNGNVIRTNDWNWDLGVNATFVKNKVSGLPAPIQTGALHGQGMSGTLSQLIANDHPINVFYTRDYRGIDPQTGQAIYVDDGNVFYFMGNPNPTTILGINTSVSYKKLTLSANMNGAFGHVIYNNTANSVLPIGNLGTRNLSSNLFKNGESLTNPITSSSRYLEKGNYLKMANATISYNVGRIGNNISNLNVFVTGQNLFVLTNYSGFDPEVNTDKQVNGIPSVGIDYIGYPSARTFLLGVNISF